MLEPGLRSMQNQAWTEVGQTSPAASAAPANPDDRTLGIVTHVLGLLTGFLGPLIVWLVKKDASPFLDQTGRRCLNFQFSLLIYGLACFLMFFTIILIPIAFLGFLAIGVVNLVFSIIGAIRASEGKVYAYPLSIRFLK